MTATWLDPPVSSVREVVARALAEDLGVFGDLTAGLLSPGATVAASIVAREPGVLAGRLAASETFAAVDPDVTVRWEVADGEQLTAGLVLARASFFRRGPVTDSCRCLIVAGHPVRPRCRLLRPGPGLAGRALSCSMGILGRTRCAGVRMSALGGSCRRRLPGGRVQGAVAGEVFVFCDDGQGRRALPGRDLFYLVNHRAAHLAVLVPVSLCSSAAPGY